MKREKQEKTRVTESVNILIFHMLDDLITNITVWKPGCLNMVCSYGPASREPFCIHVCDHSIQQTCYKQSLGRNPQNHEKNVMLTQTMPLPKTHEVPDQLHTGF